MLALAEFQLLIGHSEDVMPQLAVFACLIQQLFKCCMVSHFFNGDEQVGAVVHIINECQEMHSGAQVPIGAGTGCTPISLGAAQIMQCARDDKLMQR